MSESDIHVSPFIIILFFHVSEIQNVASFKW